MHIKAQNKLEIQAKGSVPLYMYVHACIAGGGGEHGTLKKLCVYL